MASLPAYVTASRPAPAAKRAAWFTNTFPAYAGIFLWVGFYVGLAGPTISQANLGVCLLGLVVAGLLCFGLYYYAPAMLGMQTGRTLYIVGTSAFGTTGGYLMPGLLMGVLQIGWFAVSTYFATDYIMRGLNNHSRMLFIVLALAWAYGLAVLAIKGIAYVARAAEVLNWVPLIMIVYVLWANRGGIAKFHPADNHPLNGFLEVLAIVIGFFATAGAAGADFGMNSRNRRDVVLGGLAGITLASVVAGGIPILAVAGHLGMTSSAGMATANGTSDPYAYSAAISSAGAIAPIVFFLFAAASVAPTCFCTFVAANSFESMLPKIPRSLSTLVAVTVGAILAITGVAQNLIGFFTIVGASFGPICGAMSADYVLAGFKWSGPRQGINWAGYIAWAIGFMVGILDHLPGVPSILVNLDRPSVLWSYVIAFVVYYLLARAGLCPPAVQIEKQ